MNEETNDVYDIFSDILLSEQKISDENFKRGFEQAVNEKFNLKAYHLGKRSQDKSFLKLCIHNSNLYRLSQRGRNWHRTRLLSRCS
jgi:hypothetical protein